jgi:hypothetical protein
LKVDNETLLVLLKGGHLSMPDRIARGLWPHAPLFFDTVANYLATVLEQGDAWFPYRWEPHRSGELVQEGGTIERQQVDRYVYRTSAHHPTSPTTLSQTEKRVFANARGAALHYLNWDLHLPGDLDGWKVLK